MHSSIKKDTSEVIKDFYKSLHFVQKDMTEKMSASALIQTMEYLMKKNKKNVIEFLSENKKEFDLLKSDKGEYLFVHEFISLNEFKIICRYHFSQELIGKNNEEINKYVNNTLIKDLNFRTNVYEIVKRGWDACKNQINSKKLSANYTNISYKWYSFLKKKPYIKRALVKLIKIKDTYFLIGCGIHTEDFIVEKPNFLKKNSKFLFVSFISLFLYYLKVQNINNIGLFIYFSLMLYVNYIILSTMRNPDTYENELKEREELNKIALSVGATICALIIGSNILKFSSDTIKQNYQRNLLSSFAILIFTVLIEPYDNTGIAVHKTSSIQQILILLTFNIVLMTLLSYLFKTL